MTSTAVFFHAHPDDEALLTSGTMAKAAAAGHRVVLVTATDGALGLASEDFGDPEHLAATRMRELQASADALGVARVVHLGYADSGMEGEVPPDPLGRLRFLHADIEDAAARLADILREEQAKVLVTYDPAGGYGHRDHVRASQVGMRAGELAETEHVLQATVPRDLIVRALRLARRVYRFPPEFDLAAFERSFSASADITHRIDVSRFLDQKRASMRAHSSQASADQGDRTLAIFLRFPKPLYRLVFRREWYVEPARPRDGGAYRHDIFE